MSDSNTIRQSLTLNPTFPSSVFTFDGLTFALTPTEPASRFDVRFLQETIGHHQMAVDMAQLSVEKAINSDLRDLSQNIITTQTQEIEIMQSWLKDWYGYSYTPQKKPGDMRMLDQMAMMSGAEFEIDFMQEMTDHHKSMLSDAVPCTYRAGHDDLTGLCHNIVDTQTREINQMQQWLSERYGISDNMNEPVSNHVADAAIANGSFETSNFTGWSTIGKAEIETADFGTEPAEGTYYAALSTQFDTVSGLDIETFLGLPAGSLNVLEKGNIEEGSAMKTTFTAKAGDVLTLDWNFMTNELDSTLVGSNNDFAFLTLNSLPYDVADPSSSFKTSLTPFLNETGFQTLSIEIPVTGTYTLGLGVVNVDDPIFDSALAVDNIKLTSNHESTSLSGVMAFDTLGLV
ncbi:hypothetical protein DP113_33445 (plasmid) [Brasilonema octagenarum UFV-E1]|uniref:DUF305 domain-containing protein n=2 Tax=Brasilonema TaxID=383614 RepID=A0A856MR55_9CYAN|nr:MULTISPECIES: DUF305 domain-containing protein [Brasilonema]NMF62581.1 hypothetical protein [Brasilonema octagenarum UFV-OR1]QDL12640.1 hypothetical protein DP114_33340 [Brasilonema sennae CENA114]QDL19034.1 hypothetical protein DP113_33445 [Brasilonema octagenarum UFV-E1]